jgi:hypothetical protein
MDDSIGKRVAGREAGEENACLDAPHERSTRLIYHVAHLHFQASYLDFTGAFVLAIV